MKIYENILGLCRTLSPIEKYLDYLLGTTVLNNGSLYICALSSIKRFLKIIWYHVEVRVRVKLTPSLSRWDGRVFKWSRSARVRSSFLRSSRFWSSWRTALPRSKSGAPKFKDIPSLGWMPRPPLVVVWDWANFSLNLSLSRDRTTQNASTNWSSERAWYMRSAVRRRLDKE